VTDLAVWSNRSSNRVANGSVTVGALPFPVGGAEWSLSGATRGDSRQLPRLQPFASHFRRQQAWPLVAASSVPLVFNQLGDPGWSKVTDNVGQ
jgi:hypothetical protein